MSSLVDLEARVVVLEEIVENFASQIAELTPKTMTSGLQSINQERDARLQAQITDLDSQVKALRALIQSLT